MSSRADKQSPTPVFYNQQEGREIHRGKEKSAIANCCMEMTQLGLAAVLLKHHDGNPLTHHLNVIYIFSPAD